MFKLLRYFSITSAIAISLMTLVLAFSYWKIENAKMISTIEAQNMVLAKSFANIIWPKYKTHVNAVGHLDGDALRRHPVTLDIHATLKDLTTGLPILKVKMYSLDALTVYSSQFSQMGASKRGNKGFEATLNSEKPTTKTSFRETFASFDGPVKDRHLVESYLPIIGENGQLEGIFELYSDVTPLVGEINNMTVKVMMALFASFGLLYAVLFWVVRHASGVMKKQHIDLVAAQKEATSSNMAKSSFLATMSHEIRTPLNGVLGLAQLLLNGDLTKEQKRHVKTILSSGETLLAIISDVLDMSKIEASGIQLENKAFNLKNLISIIATPFQSLIDDKGLTLTVKFDFDSALTVKGDPVRLRQILWNLISNAIKFTEKGSITVRIRKVNAQEVGISETKDMVLNFAVIDTGGGIAPNRLDKIFDPFTQENSSITRKHGGTGLGLAIVKQLTELMGGIIKVESRLNEGTRFDVFIPLNKENNRLVEEAPPILSEHKASLKVIVAEDNDVNATIATAFLKKAGCQVRLAENGWEAVVASRENWADLILMDIHMPEMNGIDATIEIRSVYDKETLPIIGLTADAFVERHEQFEKAGMNSVLTKPFTELQLNEMLDIYRNPASEEKAVS